MDTNFQTIDESTFTDPILKEVESVLYFIVQNYKSFIQDSTNTHEKISEFDKELGDVLERYRQLYNITSNITEEELQKIASEFRTEIAKLKTSTELLNSDLTKKVTVDYKGLIDAQLQSVDNLITDINNKVTNDYFKGDKGNPFLYSDFTPEQLESLKVKGDKGDPFKYTDFTPSQLDSLMDIHSKTAKTTPSDADEITLADSTSSFSLKKITWATIKTLFANRLPTSTLNALVKFGDTVGTLKNGVGAYLTDSGNMLIGTTVDNGVDKLQVNGSITHKSSHWKYANANDACVVIEQTVVNNSCLNIPYNDYGYLSVIVSDQNLYCMQTFTGLNAPARLFIRVMANGNWSSWVEK